MELNNIPASGTWSETVGVLTSNFEKVNVEVEKLKVSTIRFKGYYPTIALLNDNVPTPKLGDIAWVGSPFPGVIYDVLEDGTWHPTTDVPEIEVSSLWGVFSNGTVSMIQTLTTAQFSALETAGELDETTIYIVIDPEQQASIAQILADLSAAIDSKADATAVNEALNTLTSALSSKANQQDLLSLSVIVTTSVIEQEPDWLSVFARNGSWIFVDDEHGANRPVGFVEPGVGTQRKYNVQSWAVSTSSRPTVQVRDMTDGSLYVLTLETDNSITVQGLATSVQIGQISTALDSIQSIVTAIIG